MRSTYYLLLLAPLCAMADDDVARVEIKASSSLQQRRDDNVGRIVIMRDELLRHGDSTVADTLRRQAGVTVNGNEVRLRGLGGGRTQFLLNGEPAPPGFSPDSLAPELIERVEIMRSASADSSSQGIAGSINIILRRTANRTRSLATLAGARNTGGWAPEALLDLAWPGESLSGTLAAQASHSQRTSTDTILERSPAGVRFTSENGEAASQRFGLTPRLNWKSGGGSSIAWQGLLDLARNRNVGDAQESTLWGTPSDYPRNAFGATARTVTARNDVTGSHQLGDAVTLEWKAGLSHNRRDGDYLFTGSSAEGDPLWLRRVLSNAIDDGVNSSGKLLMGTGGGHALAVGWDGMQARRSEWRHQEDSSAAGAPLGGMDQRYAVSVRRLAAFAQDEWSPCPALDLYLGLRWEGLRGQPGVWSPVAHMLWRLPGTRDQLRIALARSYKAPNTRDLVPRRFTVNNANGPTNPHVQGNPALKPELAWGLDLAYEAYFGKDNMLSISAYQRRIDNVIQPVLFQDKGEWVSMPSNAGKAVANGVELDGRFALGSPAAMARFTLSRNWSHVAVVPGPDNRLGEQLPLAMNAGLDYRFNARATAGFNWNVQGGGTSRNSLTQWSERGFERRLDVQGSWQLRPGVSIRASVSNLLRPVTHSALRFNDGGGDTRRDSSFSGNRVARLALEVRI